MTLRRITSFAAGTALVFGTLAIATPANAATTQLWVANAYSYDAGDFFEYTVCLDGADLTSLETTEITGPFDVETGEHLFEVFAGFDADCAGDGADFSQTLTVPDSPSATAMLFWPDEGNLDVSVFADDLTCTPQGSGRLLVRNGALTYAEGIRPARVTAIGPDGEPITLASELPVGEEAADEFAPGTYTDVDIAPQYDPVPLDDIVVTEGVVTAVYFYGGADGSIGTFSATSNVGVCSDDTTTTTSSTTSTSTTTTTAAPVAQAATTTPRYAG